MQRPLKATDNNTMRGIEEMFAAHDGRISTLSERMSGVEKKMDSIQIVLQDIRTSMAASAALQQARSPIAFGMVLAYTRDMAVLLTMAVAGIVYVVQSSTGARTAVMEYRLDEISKQAPHGALPMGGVPLK